jgi:hypothetical protein
LQAIIWDIIHSHYLHTVCWHVTSTSSTVTSSFLLHRCPWISVNGKKWGTQLQSEAEDSHCSGDHTTEGSPVHVSPT